MHKLKNKNQVITPAYKIFNTRFLVRVQNKAFFTAFELENVGFVSCGSAADNETYLNEYRLIKTTLDKIVEWNYRGDSIRLVDLKDASKMFHILDEHMNNWVKITRLAPTAKLPPIDDFEAMDRLCEMLYPLVDINVAIIEDPSLMMLFGNAMSLGFMLPAENEDGVIKEPYAPYSPKLYSYTQYRWEK